jgi:hypothetical protein
VPEDLSTVIQNIPGQREPSMDIRDLMKRIEKDVSEEIKGDIFLSMLFDKILEESKLTQSDVDEIDHKVKKGIMENLEWK